MLIVIIRSVILYFIIVFSLRLMGKKQLAQLQPSELVTTILISNIATMSLENPSMPMVYGIVPIIMIVSLDVIMSFVLLKSMKIRRLVTGTPQIIISGGIIDRKVMRHLRYSVEEVMEAMRENGIFDIDEVQYAIVETNGKINFYQKSRYRTVTNGDMDITAKNCDPPALLIKDGEINYPVLTRWDGGEKKLCRILRERGVRQKDVFIMTDSEENGVNIILKDGKSVTAQKKSKNNSAGKRF